MPRTRSSNFQAQKRAVTPTRRSYSRPTLSMAVLLLYLNAQSLVKEISAYPVPHLGVALQWHEIVPLYQMYLFSDVNKLSVQLAIS